MFIGFAFSQSITITYPNGGEILMKNTWSPHNITWQANGVTNFYVEYSTNNGSTWSEIGTFSTNYASWTTPDISSNQCLIRVSDADNAAIFDQSNEVFFLTNQQTYYAKWQTSMGNFKASLPGELVPTTVQNFINLIQKDFYTDLIFHRVIADFMIQDGCPNGTGTGGPGYEFNDEFHQSLTFDNPRVLGMANAGPNTNGSQYFITVDEYSYGNGVYSIFGRVTDGYDVVYNISEVETDANDKPLVDVDIYSISLVDESNKNLSIDYPVGGESLIEGYNLPISWTSNLIADVKIEFSDDNGSTWQTIVDSIPSDEELFQWQLPKSFSDECIIKITDLNNSAYFTQTGLFEIRVKPVKLKRIEFFEGVSANSDNPHNLIMPLKPLRFRVKILNDCSQDLTNVGLKLIQKDSLATITVDSLAVGSLSQGEQLWLDDYFELILPEEITENGTIDFNINISAQNFPDTPWINLIEIPYLNKFQSVDIDDDNNPDSQGNNNDIAEPDEIIEIIQRIENASNDTIFEVYGKLTTSASFINIWNNVQGVDRIVYDTTKYNSFNPIVPGAAFVSPQNDFVFDYNADEIYNSPFVLELHGYINDNPGATWQSGGIKAVWGLPLVLNESYPSDIKNNNKTDEIFYIFDTENKLKFFFKHKNNNPFFASIYDLKGRKIYSQFFKQKNDNIYKFDNLILQQGIYILNLKSDYFNLHRKFLID